MILDSFRHIRLSDAEILNAKQVLDSIRSRHGEDSPKILNELIRIDSNAYHTTGMSSAGNSQRARLAKRLRAAGLMRQWLASELVDKVNLFPEIPQGENDHDDSPELRAHILAAMVRSALEIRKAGGDPTQILVELRRLGTPDGLNELRQAISDSQRLGISMSGVAWLGWIRKGSSPSGKTHWFNEETREHRYQEIEPGTRGAGQQQPVAATAPGQQPAPAQVTEKEAVNHLAAIEEHLAELSTAELEQAAAKIGEWKIKNQKLRDDLIEKIKNYAESTVKATGPATEHEDRSPLHGEHAFPKGTPAVHPSKIDRMPGLTPEERAIEDKAVHKVENEYPQLRTDYLKQNAVRDEQGGIKSVTINTDDWRDLFEGYRGTNAQAVHEPASFANKQLLSEMLQEQKGKGNNTVAIYAGGGGSGKGTAIKQFFDEDDFPIRIDQVTDNVKKANALFDRIKAEGYVPQYVFVDRPPADAWTGVVQRAINLREKGKNARTVPLDIAIKANIEARRAALEIVKNRADALPKVIDNTSGEPGARRLLTVRNEAIQFLENRIKEDEAGIEQTKGRLRQEILDRHANGEIPTDIARGLYGSALWDDLNKEKANATERTGIPRQEPISGDHAGGAELPGSKDDRRAQPGRTGGLVGTGEQTERKPAATPQGTPGKVRPQLSKDDYTAQAMANLKKTSRTAGGVIDTSASAGKAEKMTEGLTGEKAAELATKNFEDAIHRAHSEANSRRWTSPAFAGQVADDLNTEINRGIVKAGTLYRTDDSTKFPYTNVADLPLAKQQFDQELSRRLTDPKADPVETAAWIEWRANLTDHFWADGVGKTARALAAIPLMRAGLPLPQYRDNKEYFSYSQRERYDPKKGPETYLDGNWERFRDYYKTLMPGAEKPADQLPGGKADNIPPSEFPPEKVAQGAKVESEHTNDQAKAAEIARDHLAEDPNYYDKLAGMEAPKKIRDLYDRSGDTSIPMSEIDSTLSDLDELGKSELLDVADTMELAGMKGKKAADIRQAIRQKILDRRSGAQRQEMVEGQTEGGKAAAAEFEQAQGKKPEEKKHIDLAKQLAEKFKAGDAIDAAALWEAANKAYGGTRAEGKYGPSEAYDALETGFNESLRGQSNPAIGDLATAQDEAREIEKRISQLPTQTNRSGNKDEFQQFSTPPHYAYAAAWLANLDNGDTVLEPSAGTGCLAIQAENAGATVYANELDPQRADYLKHLFGDDKVHIENAEQIAGILPGKGVPAPSAIIMNPPFSATAGRMGDKKELMTGAKHIEEAGRLLAPGGRLVSIVGRGMSPESPTYKEWFAKMAKSGMTLRANMAVSGDEYKKYGTHFGTRLLVFDKMPATGKEPVTGEAKDIPDLMAQLEGIRNDRQQPTQAAQRPTGEPIGGKTAAPGAPGGTAASGTPAATGELPSGANEPAGAGEPSGPALERGPDTGAEPAGGRSGGNAEGAAGEAERKDADSGGISASASDIPAGTRKRRGRGRSAGGKPSEQPANRVILRDPEPLKIETATKPEQQTPAEKKAASDLSNDSDALFETYRPSKLRIPGAQKHPSSLVESSAMAAVDAPDPTYRPVLSPDILEKGLITEPALENIVYAGQAHSQFLEAAEGDAIAGAKFIGPNGESTYLSVLHGSRDIAEFTGNKQIVHWWWDGLDGSPTFETANEAARWLASKGWKKPDGSDIETDVAYRRGYFIGDGTGTGKGRQIAGIITDNFNQGRKKAVWLTEKQTLLEDATRDWKDIGNDPKQVFHFNNLKKKAEPAKEGVCFLTYDTLKGKPRKPEAGAIPNIDRLVNWLGKDFDGVIAFDEAHNMGNATREQGSRGFKNASQRALAGLELQRRLPNARVVYVSATGATEVANFAYADRLGLWGRGTAFPDKASFIDDMNRGGVAAMECVAQNMKAMGSYMARSLSYDDGTPDGRVTYNRLTHALTPDQREMYDTLAEGWQHVFKNIDAALESTGGIDSANAKSAAMSAFWSAEQRFFNQLMTSIQVPSVIKSIEQDIKEGKAPVIQLVNTMEASMDRAKQRMMENRDEGDELDWDELDVSPREILMKFIGDKNHPGSFPVYRYEKFVDEEGNEGSRPVMDSSGKPVEDPAAVALRDDLLNKIGTFKIPESPLDSIINHFGHENVAEATGRTKRIVEKEQDDGTRKKEEESRSAKTANAVEARAFQDGKKKLLIFSDAGGTGRSYHANRNDPNTKKRIHYLLQPGWRADKAIQGLGRTHRTNQASAPEYRLVEIDAVKAQRRFITTIARRLDQLGALTRGQRQAGSAGLFKAADNMESPQANEALEQFFADLHNGQIEGMDEKDVLTQLGYYNERDEERRRDAGRPPKEFKIPPMTQFLNRMMSLRIDTQATLFDAFDQRLQQKVEQAIRDGTMDVGVENYPAQSIHLDGEDVVYKDEKTNAQAKHLTVKAQVKHEKTSWEGAHRFYTPLYYVRNKQSGRVRAVYKWTDKTDARTGRVEEQVKISGPGGSKFAKPWEVNPNGYSSRYEELTPEEAKTLWEQEYAEIPDTKETTQHFIAGAFLPVWDRLPKDKPKIYRLKLDNGQTTVARHIPPSQVEATLNKLGVSMTKAPVNSVDLHSRLSRGDLSVTLANDWKLKPVRVQGERRIEIYGPDYQHARELEKDGVIQERINFNTRFFIPTGEEGERVLARIIKNRPVAEEHEIG